MKKIAFALMASLSIASAFAADTLTISGRNAGDLKSELESRGATRLGHGEMTSVDVRRLVCTQSVVRAPSRHPHANCSMVDGASRRTLTSEGAGAVHLMNLLEDAGVRPIRRMGATTVEVTSIRCSAIYNMHSRRSNLQCQILE